MPTDISHKLIVGISSRALFDLDESHRIYEQQGVAAYRDYQISHENEPLKPGASFSLVKKLLTLCDPKTQERMVEVVLISRNSADTGLRIFNSIQHHKLSIERAAFTEGKSPYQYITAFGAHLFLSANPEDVKNALNANCAAATIMSPVNSKNVHDELRIAFDGDAVIFSDEAETIYQKEGLKSFQKNEQSQAKQALSGGPFKGFLATLHNLQKRFPEETCPIRTALVTARSAPAHERVIHTLREWDIRIDEALFLGGLDKSKFLKAFAADVFFDDQQGHCESATKEVATGHVPHGVMNAN